MHATDDPAVRLAPLYDVLSTIALELRDHLGQPMRAETRMGQRVGGQTDIQQVTTVHLIDEATRWGLRRRAASTIVTDTLDRILATIPSTPGDERVLAIIKQQAERVRLDSRS
ncbi:hypothetical protein [Pseudofrankia sp. EUN1h]|uniref:hypothetical protein n=1 Tax=Pseudofrankia sp. EUN1h TaxID=1834515 RepID=UPI001E364CA4|nr:MULTISPECIES: hypothetical protein [Pseudofrankia]